MEKITIAKDMVTYLTSSQDTIMSLFDADETTPWFPGWESIYPAKVLITLPSTYKIEKLYVKNYTGTRRFNIYAGTTPFNTTILKVFNLTQYLESQEIVVNTTCKYLVLEIPDSKTSSPANLIIYGTKVADEIEAPVTFPANVDGLFGINGFHWVPSRKLTGVTSLRMFQDWKWFETSKDKYTFAPTHDGDGDYDVYYQALKDLNIEPVATVHNNPAWTGLNSEYIPAIGSTTDPKSYIQFAKMFFQYVARYGSTKVNLSLLSVNPAPRWTNDKINTLKTGLNLVKYFEVWNEPDKWWKPGTPANATPAETAAMISACADGHCGTMGNNVGIKTADPNAKVVMGGLTSFNLDYVGKMYDWWKANRPDGKAPIDVFNFHHYANSNNNGNGQSSTTSIGVSPEENDIKGKIKDIKSILHHLSPTNEIWLSEYGYVTSTGSSQRCPAIGTMSQYQVQGAWIVRSILEMAAAGLDKAYLYEVYDQSSSQTELWGKAGIYTSQALDVKKPIANYLETLTPLLKGYKFSEDLSTSTIRKYKFVNGNKEMFAIWMPTSTGATSTHALPTAFYSKVKTIELLDNSNVGKSTIIPSTVTFNIPVTELPIFIEAEKMAPPIPAEEKPAQKIPGIIQAESFTAQSGTNTVAGKIGWVDQGDWLDYIVEVAKAGTYIVNMSLAVAWNSVVEIQDISGKTLVAIPLIGVNSFDNYVNYTAKIDLPAGKQTLRVFARTSGWNFDHMTFEEQDASLKLAAPSTVEIPSGSICNINGVNYIGPKTIIIE